VATQINGLSIQNASSATSIGSWGSWMI